ncbi:hypothetical protein KPC_2909 [Acinetobacter stercoris]|uniref:TIGR02594 family protein n=1 Tax=Acinetobacter stercoris TaxID=2126983 RepID=A0A2U3N240_9GAMM|nr:hypothetical protein KPC_2909 [Acinetobacter stercoris]
MSNQKPELAWMVEAYKHNGLKENTSKTTHNPTILGWLKELKAWWSEDETPWCGVFVAICLKRAGVEYPKLYMRALEYRDTAKKLSKPAYGCVAIKTRTGGGHVFFVVGKTTTGKIVGYGGNQNNSVCYATFEPSELEYYWYGKTNRPADIRYVLPVIKSVSATKVCES